MSTQTIAQALEGLLSAGERLESLERIERMLESMAADRSAAALLAATDGRLHPDHTYRWDEAAKYVGKEAETLRREPEAILPPVRSRGRKIGVRGIDLLAYRGDVTRAEAEAYKAAQRAAILR